MTVILERKLTMQVWVHLHLGSSTVHPMWQSQGREACILEKKQTTESK